MTSPITGKDNCIIIETFDSQIVANLYKDKIGINVNRFFTQHKEFYIAQCEDTGFRFYTPDLAGDGKFYADLQTAFGDNYYRPWKWEHSMASQEIKEGNRVLEIGCGTGYFIEKNKKTRV